MLIIFLNTLYKKPTEYQLFWLFILGHINDGNESYISLKSLKEKFGFNKTAFYRILNFGMPYFNSQNNGVYMRLENGYVIIEVIRKGNSKPTSADSTTKKNKQTATINNNTAIIEEVIDYLNQKTNKNYSAKSNNSTKFINARITDGFKLDDFKKVIDIKCEKWLNTSWEDYLRPQTLFSPKMDSYLNEKIIKNNTKNERFAKTQSAVDEAKELDWFNQ